MHVDFSCFFFNNSITAADIILKCCMFISHIPLKGSVSQMSI